MRIKFLKALHGDCTLVSFGGKNLLIDGGAVGCYYDANLNAYGELKTEVEAIRQRRERIDLLILTHIDNDHICGLLKWFEMDENALELISHIWFNSGLVLARLLDEKVNDDLKVFIQKTNSALTGVTEALEFEDHIGSHKIWDKQIWISGMVLEQPDFKIEIISPEEKQLRKLIKEHKSKLGEQAFTRTKSSDWHLNIKDLIEEESKLEFEFQEDKSVKNGSSIAFILSTESKRVLFLADAHPNVVLNGLATFGYDKNRPLNVDLVKLSHHGSNSNTNAELLQAISTKNFFISTNGAYHSHPGKRTLARILAQDLQANIYFNYEEVRNQVFTKKDRADYQINSIVKTEFIFS